MSATLDKLIRSANQIATEFQNQHPDKAVDATWDHLWKFWDPRMVHAIVEHSRAGGGGLIPVAHEAVNRLASGGGPRPQTQATDFTPAHKGDVGSDAG